jgi:hypothetical protein
MMILYQTTILKSANNFLIGIQLLKLSIWLLPMHLLFQILTLSEQLETMVSIQYYSTNACSWYNHYCDTVEDELCCIGEEERRRGKYLASDAKINVD